MINILITGASHGIGYAAAEFFARKMGSGCRLFLCCRLSIDTLTEDCRSLTESYGCQCIPIQADVSDPEQVRKMFSQVYACLSSHGAQVPAADTLASSDAQVADFLSSHNSRIPASDTLSSSGAQIPALDILVNNAGVAHIGLLQDMTDEEWRKVIDTNLSSVFYCCRQAIPGMLHRKKGKIINISSMWGNVGASCEVAYSASKGGINSFTKALAKELAPSNIQGNAIACGVIDTRMNACYSLEEREALSQDIPAGRFGQPEEAAALIYDLACGHDYLTGQVITLDGGYC